MTARNITTPFPVFTGKDGTPLDAGYVFIGVENLEPITNPIVVYWDEALTIPALQPIRTINGYPSRSGTPSALYADANYSITVKDKNSVVAYSERSVSDDAVRLRSDLAASSGSSLVGFIQAGTGAVATDIETVLRGIVTPEQFGAVGDGVTDDTDAFNAAFATGKRVVAGAKTYALNAEVYDFFILEGQGGNSTTLMPFDLNSAAITYKKTGGPYWTYHSECRNIQFKGSSKTGIGFAFGKADVADYVSGDETSNNVKFYGCTFRDLDKGVFFPFGNIGSEFYSCNLAKNKYGIYALNNKFGAAIMHAGNKYFFSGEISENDCGIYVHNTADGFGGVQFDGTIFELNKLNAYIYTTFCFAPTLFSGVWSEGSGVNSGSATVDIDSWSGSTKTTQTIDCRSFVFDGENNICTFNAGFFADVWLKATESAITVNGSRVEHRTNFGGGSLTVDPTSSINLNNVFTDGGVGNYLNSYVHTGLLLKNNVITGNAAGSLARYFGIANLKTTNHLSSSLIKSLKFTTPVNTGEGSFTSSGTVVSDGTTYPLCNEYTLPFTSSSQYTKVLGSSITTSAGWYVATIAFKVISGTPKFYLWNKGTEQMATLIPDKNLGEWNTVAALGYSTGGNLIYLDVGGTSDAAVIRLGGYQIHRFDKMQDAINFLDNGVFVEESYTASATYNPPSLASGAQSITTIAVSGAALGDYVSASFSVALQGVSVNAWVSAANTVSISFTNLTAGVVDLGSGTITVEIAKP